MKKSLIAAGAVLALAAGPASAQDKPIKIGFVSTFSGPTAVIGNDMRNSFELALDHMGRKMGGRPVEVIYEDDRQKPDVGKQKTEKLIQSDKVDFIAGYIWSNVLLASLKPIVDSKTILIIANAGPSQIAGELCSPYVFSTSWQNDQTPQAIGEYMNQKGVKSVYPDRPELRRRQGHAGRRQASTFKGEVLGRGSDQVAGSARLLGRTVEGARRQAGRDLRVLSGRAGVQFLNSICAGRPEGRRSRSTPPSPSTNCRCRCRRSCARRSRCAAMGATTCRTTQNKKFVADYRKKYPGLRPTFYGAQAYDAAQLINSAVVAVKGDTSKKDAMRDEMDKANFKSVRGAFKYGNNHIPIQNFYLQDVVKDADGFPLSLKTVATIVKDSQDRFHDKCPMKW